MTFFFIILWETHRHPTSISGIDPFPLLLWSDHTTLEQDRTREPARAL